MSKDIKRLVDMNSCERCRGDGLTFCKCGGASNGGGDNKDAKNDRKNSYKTQFESSVATQKENKFGLVGLTKSTFTFETEQKQKTSDQQEKNALQPTPFPIKPAPSVKKDNDKQQKEDEADNIGASTENKPFHPTPFSMTMGLKPSGNS